MARQQTPQIHCVPKLLPAELQEEAARIAIEQNPANAINQVALGRMMSTLTNAPPRKEFLAVLTSKYWGAGGVKLSVAFMEQTSPELAARIIQHMNAWKEFANVEFVQTASVGNAQVRISRAGSGYWSYLGTDILSIPRGQPTMNLQGFSMATPESEYKRVVRHETGHTLGFPHEHMRGEIIDLLDRNKVIAWGARVLGWNRQTMIEQVLTPLDPSEIVGTEHADQISIMTYQLPGEVTKSGAPILGGLDLSALDKEFVAKLYPRKDGPVNPSNGNGDLIVKTSISTGSYKLVSADAHAEQQEGDDAARQLAALKPEGMALSDWWELVKRIVDMLLAGLKKGQPHQPDDDQGAKELTDEALEEVSSGADKVGKGVPSMARRQSPQSQRQPVASDAGGC